MRASKMNKIVSKHIDVLENIEVAMNVVRRSNGDLDDKAVYDALDCVCDGKETADPRISDLVDVLYEIEEMRRDLLRVEWQECLLVVRESVRNHSSLEPGDKSYLDFIAAYLP